MIRLFMCVELIFLQCFLPLIYTLAPSEQVTPIHRFAIQESETVSPSPSLDCHACCNTSMIFSLLKKTRTKGFVLFVISTIVTITFLVLLNGLAILIPEMASFRIVFPDGVEYEFSETIPYEDLSYLDYENFLVIQDQHYYLDLPGHEPVLIDTQYYLHEVVVTFPDDSTQTLTVYSNSSEITFSMAINSEGHYVLSSSELFYKDPSDASFIHVVDGNYQLDTGKHFDLISIPLESGRDRDPWVVLAEGTVKISVDSDIDSYLVSSEPFSFLNQNQWEGAEQSPTGEYRYEIPKIYFRDNLSGLVGNQKFTSISYSEDGRWLTTDIGGKRIAFFELDTQGNIMLHSNLSYSNPFGSLYTPQGIFNMHFNEDSTNFFALTHADLIISEGSSQTHSSLLTRYTLNTENHSWELHSVDSFYNLIKDFIPEEEERLFFRYCAARDVYTYQDQVFTSCNVIEQYTPEPLREFSYVVLFDKNEMTGNYEIHTPPIAVPSSVQDNPSRLSTMALNPQEKDLFISYYDLSFKVLHQDDNYLWNTTQESNFKGTIEYANFSNSGDRLITLGSSDTTYFVTSWKQNSLQEWEPNFEEQFLEPISAISLNQQEDKLLVLSSSDWVNLYSYNQEGEWFLEDTFSLFDLNGSYFDSIEFAPDGDSFALIKGREILRYELVGDPGMAEDPNHFVLPINSSHPLELDPDLQVASLESELKTYSLRIFLDTIDFTKQDLVRILGSFGVVIMMVLAVPTFCRIYIFGKKLLRIHFRSTSVSQTNSNTVPQETSERTLDNLPNTSLRKSVVNKILGRKEQCKMEAATVCQDDLNSFGSGGALVVTSGHSWSTSSAHATVAQEEFCPSNFSRCELSGLGNTGTYMVAMSEGPFHRGNSSQRPEASNFSISSSV